MPRLAPRWCCACRLVRRNGQRRDRISSSGGAPCSHALLLQGFDVSTEVVRSRIQNESAAELESQTRFHFRKSFQVTKTRNPGPAEAN